MNKKEFFHILIIFYILILNLEISICSKIQRKHRHPGSSQSDNSNIEIEPLNDGNKNIDENNKPDSGSNTNNQNNPQPSYYNEDDEFVYGKRDDVLNLDQELEKGQKVNPRPGNIPNSHINYDTSKLDPEMQRRLKEQQEMYNNMYNKPGGPNIPNGPGQPGGPHMYNHPGQPGGPQMYNHPGQPGGPHMYNPNQPGGPHMYNPNQPGGPYNPGQPGGPHMYNHPGQPGQPGPDVYRTGVDEHGQPYTYTAGEGPHTKYQNQEQNGEVKTNVSKTRKALGVFYQLIMVFFLVSFVYNFFLGKNQNDKHALVWYNANKDYFEERYEYFGLEDDDKLSKKIPRNNFIRNCKMSKENPYYYKLSCANYRYIHYLTVVLEFKKRYDVTSLLSSIFISPKDRIVFQVSFKPKDDLGWIFCVCKKRKAKNLKKSYEDLNYFCEIYEPSSFNNYMALISESLEVFMELFNNKSLFNYYKEIEDYLDAIYFSDMLNMEVEGTNIFFSFSIDLTKPKQEKTLIKITHFVNLFVDTLAQLKYNKEFKEKTRKSRIAYERTKMDSSKKKEIEEKEEKDFIEKCRIIRKMKTKKGAERRRLERELKNYQ